MRYRVERIALGIAVLGLHALLWWAWQHALLSWSPGRVAPPEPRPLLVRLLADKPPPPRAAAAAPARDPRAAPPSEVPAPRVVARAEPHPQAITMAPPPPERPASAAEREQALFDTTLPRSVAAPARRSLREQMLNDPRSNSPSATVESRVAVVAGDVAISEERMDATRMRVRQRGACVEVHVSRNAQIDPWNQSVQPTPKQVKPSC